MSGPGTVVKSVALLNLVAERPGLTLTELGQHADLPTATAHRLLRALIDEGLLRIDPANRYHLGSHCLYLGSRFLEDVDLRLEAEEHLRRLVDETGETAHMGVLEGTDVVYLAKVDSPHPVRMHSRIGGRFPLYCTAMGKAMLAFSDRDIVDRVVDKGMPRRTPNTITTPDGFAAELAAIRERGWAFDDIENEEGIRCVAAPVLLHGRRPVAAISVAAPEARMSDERVAEICVAVVEETKRLAEVLGNQRSDEA